ncbi:MAG: nonstructural protein [Microvirus sp.]|nr:MAG: nonstructural protein [Microvirus sp.]
MKHQIVAVYDRAIEAYSRPVFVNALGAAMRTFGDECRDPETEVSKHPEDYELYHLGEYDDQDGTFLTTTPHRLARAQDLKDTTK